MIWPSRIGTQSVGKSWRNVHVGAVEELLEPGGATRRRRRAGRAGSSRARRSAAAPDRPSPAGPPSRPGPRSRARRCSRRRRACRRRRVEQPRLEVAALRPRAGTGFSGEASGPSSACVPSISAPRAARPSEPSGRGCVSVWLPIQWPSARRAPASARYARSCSPTTKNVAFNPRSRSTSRTRASPPGPGRCRR